MAEIYNYLFIQLSKPLTYEWPLISSPFPLMFIIFGYIYFVLYIGPRYMKDRPPYKLKNFILFYNLIQILANSWLTKEFISSGWFSEYSIICSGSSDPDSPNALKIFNYIWWVLLLKLFDLVETCVFVLRKKQKQVSPLHVHHHVSNIFFIWLFLKYVLDERGSFVILLNCAVHVIMYMYYFMSARSQTYQIVSFLKPFITRIQMVQFIIIIMYALQMYNPACQIDCHSGLIIVFKANILLFLYLFYDFYKKNYYADISKEKNK